MMLFGFVIKDSLHRKRRVLYAALGVIIGTMTVIGILTISRAGETKIYNQLEKYGPNLSVLPAIDNLDLKLGGINMGSLSVGNNHIDEKYLPLIQQIADTEIKRELEIEAEDNIAIVAPKLYENTVIDNTSIVVVGIEPQEEKKIKSWWMLKKGEFIEKPDQALIGGVAADLLDFDIGDRFDLGGTSIIVSGILDESGSNDDYQVFIYLKTAQDIFDKEGLISAVDIRALCIGCPVEIIANGINKNIPGARAIAVKQVAEAEMGMMDNIKNFMLTLAGITLLVGLFGVINTMVSSVNERIKDIGIMRAIGASRGQIIKIFIFEAVFIGVLGGVVGYIAGSALAFAIGPVIFNDITVRYIPEYLLFSLGIASTIAIVASIYPAFTATRIKVADSFRA